MLGQRIKEARLAQGLSQEELGSLIDVTKATISWYESNSRTPTLGNFVKLITVLNLNAEYALGREISVVNENLNYAVKVSKKDLEIISTFKKYKNMYNKLYEDPKRTIELIDRKLK